jgi:two-component system response regulator HydG/two-component system response regulator AtoC
MVAVRNYVAKVARRDCSVLITGETGTGKEVVARLISELGPRRARRLECINCAALPDTLLESELFGYERGAFTGADRAYPGRLRLAAGGTVFLDEIGEMTPQGQAKLLRAIEAREIVPLGGYRSVPLDVRILAATNQDPEEMVRDRRFRSDLFFRLSVARVHLPPLRERKEDVIPLFEQSLHELNGRYRVSVDRVASDVYERLLSYPWPGNVRELRNVVEAIFIDPPAQEITMSDLPPPLRWTATPPGGAEGERDRLISALSTTRWNKSKAAKHLRWSRMTLYRKMSKYSVPQEAPASLAWGPRRSQG